jgi:hypothetical protein
MSGLEDGPASPICPTWRRAVARRKEEVVAAVEGLPLSRQERV